MSICTWDNVGCEFIQDDNNEQLLYDVNSFSLESFDLLGSLPTEIGGLTNLGRTSYTSTTNFYINGGGEEVYGTIPTEIAKISGFNGAFYISSNAFASVIPVSIALFS